MLLRHNQTVVNAIVTVKREAHVFKIAHRVLLSVQIVGVVFVLGGHDLGIVHALHRFPAVSGIEKENVLLDTDIFIQTSRLEGMPMGILEAMSYGIPCLVTEGTTLGGFISENHCGWHCATNAKSVADTLMLAINEVNKLYEFSNNARIATEKTFSWNTIAIDTIKNYTQFAKILD